MFEGDEDTFASLFDKLLSFASVKRGLGLQTSSRWSKERPGCYGGGCIEQWVQVDVWLGQEFHFLAGSKTGHMCRDCFYKRGMVECYYCAMTSLEIAHPTKETGHVERATRKAKARTNARVQSKRQWEQADPLCTTGSAMLARFGTLDVQSMHGGTNRASDLSQTRARSGSSSTATHVTSCISSNVGTQVPIDHGLIQALAIAVKIRASASAHGLLAIHCSEHAIASFIGASLVVARRCHLWWRMKRHRPQRCARGR